jgi:hypothetical protein
MNYKGMRIMGMGRVSSSNSSGKICNAGATSNDIGYNAAAHASVVTGMRMGATARGSFASPAAYPYSYPHPYSYPQEPAGRYGLTWDQLELEGA